jgi:hypothetical protein
MTKPIVAFHGFAKAPVPQFHFTSKFTACCRIKQRYSTTVLDKQLYDTHGATEMAVHPTVTLTES